MLYLLPEVYIMQEIIKNIRTAAGLSQQELADHLGVAFATINRWENGHSIPNKAAQNALYSLCKARNIPVNNLTLQKIQNASPSLKSTNAVILYHGSKSGLTGSIAPVSRARCDFGAGFYMGTDPAQPLTLICDFDKSKFYVLSLQLDGLRTLEVPADLEWAMLVAYNRGRMESIRQTALYEKYHRMCEGVDIVIGSIANDRMFYVLDNFFQGNITDQALVKSLSALQLGKQYVAITQKGCDAVKIEQEVPISHLERRFLQDLSASNRANGISMANSICKDYRREGMFFDEILEQAKEADAKWTASN
jgi:transcriptional regulator with XRE-family HTH domain